MTQNRSTAVMQRRVEAHVLHGDCRALMAAMPEASVDAIVTDPPYELAFMGRAWDATGVAFDPDTWRAALRVLKPGGHLLAFGGSRTYHRLACAIEDAGFDIRDQIMWIYGSGFPKSHNVSMAVDRHLGVEGGRGDYKSSAHASAGDRVRAGGGRVAVHTRPYMSDPKAMDAQRRSYVAGSVEAEHWSGWGTALKPAHEPIVVARKPLVGTVAATVLAHSTGALNIDGCRIASTDDQLAQKYASVQSAGSRANSIYGVDDRDRAGSAPHDGGRWPANVIHDGSDEVVALFPSAPGGAGGGQSGKPSVGGASVYGGGWNDGAGRNSRATHDTGSAARFFYCAKASKADRDEGLDAFAEQQFVQFQTANGTSGRASSLSEGRDTAYRNTHPTVKPTALMRYLCRLVTPPGGTVLDPFTGSGSTGKAAVLEGFGFIGCELTEAYLPIARARIAAAQADAQVEAERAAAEIAARHPDLFDAA